MRNFFIAALSLAALCGQLYAQGMLEPHQYMRHGVIEHHATTATVKADFGTPLQQAITAVREEYGWVVDYEDPPYQGKHDVVDMTNPKYRAAHPNAPVVLGPAGGAFQSTYPEMPHMWSSPAMEQEVLEKIVSDYNQSGNPGNFVVRELPDGSFDVVGDSIHDNSGDDVATTPVLDTSISIPSAVRSYGGTIGAILDDLSAKTGISIVEGTVPTNLFVRGQLRMGGTSASARDLLIQAITPMGAKWVWNLLYRPRDRTYVLNIEIATRAVYDSFSQKRLVPIGPMPVPGP